MDLKKITWDNIEDIDPKEYLPLMLERQQELWEKYKDIELDLPQDLGLDVNLYATQVIVKDFLWRITEEIAEALECEEFSNLTEGEVKEHHSVHLIEELSDAMHFMLELMLIADVEPSTWLLEDAFTKSKVQTPVISENEVTAYEETPLSFKAACLRTFTWLGLSGNTLKNRPWKQTAVETDILLFDENIRKAFNSLVGCFDAAKVTPKGLFMSYMAKSEINKVRQAEKY
jgi:hypothetical protein